MRAEYDGPPPDDYDFDFPPDHPRRFERKILGLLFGLEVDFTLWAFGVSFDFAKPRGARLIVGPFCFAVGSRHG